MGTSPCCANRQLFPYCVENMIYKLVFVLASLYAITASPIVPEDSMVEVFTGVQTEAALNMELLTEVTKHPVHVQYQALGLLKMAHAQNGGEPSPTDDLELWEDDADFSQQGENWKWAKKTFKKAKRTVRRTYRRAKRTARRAWQQGKRSVKKGWKKVKKVARKAGKAVKRGYETIKKGAKVVAEAVKKAGRIIGAHLKK